jgi:hypothetical protein
MPANLLQAAAIARYHHHLQRLGRAGTLDDTARHWVARFAHLWRARFEGAGRAA